MSLFSDSLHYIGRNIKDANVVQVGAMDGDYFDEARGFLDMYAWPALLIEPIPHLYKELVTNFRSRPNYKFEMSAITDRDGDIEMLTIPPEILIGQDLPLGYKGMSAVWPPKNGFGSDYKPDIDVKEKYGKIISVNGITLNTLFNKHGITNCDIFLCDAEGHDYVIFKQIDFKEIRPLFLRLEHINLTVSEQDEIIKTLNDNNYVVEISDQDIDAVDKFIYKKMSKKADNGSLTVVTGLWNIGRENRDFEGHYLERFREFLDMPVNMFVYIQKEYEHIVWEKRDRNNTYVRVYELEDVKHLYSPFWDKTQKIRKDPGWFNLTGEHGWLKDSPQAALEWYNPIVQSKMFMLNDVTIWNPFTSKYFVWMDAGLTNTVPHSMLVSPDFVDNLSKHIKEFLFLSYGYEARDEIHGFKFKEMNRYAGQDVKYVCRGGLFGGTKAAISEANATYYSLLERTLSRHLMGTEESIFSIMAYLEPNKYRRYELDDNGLVVKFVEAVMKDNVALTGNYIAPQETYEKDKVKTAIYFLTFNYPDQIRKTLEILKETPEWLETPYKYIFDNSTNAEARNENATIASEYGFEHIITGDNKGICGGRQLVAEHFDKTDADYYVFFEDDMTLNGSDLEGRFCRNGFRKYVVNLWEIMHNIIIKEKYDYLKLTFTEVYMDNHIQVSWYNVPQEVRTKIWPEYDKLPVTGLDPNCPRTRFKKIDILDGVSYAEGDVYYCNWPCLMSKEGNRKVFIETQWSSPFEQTWMSFVFSHQTGISWDGRQIVLKEPDVKAAVLLASPITHDRFKHYKAEERREN